MMRGAGSITFVSGGVLVLVAWALAATALPTPYSALTSVLAEPLGLLLVVLAWRFRRSRLAIAATVVGIANLLLRGLFVQQLGQTTSIELSLLAFLFAFNLGVVVLLRDHPLAHPRTLVHATAVMVQFPIAAGLLHVVGQATSVSAPLSSWLRLLESRDLALLMFLIAAVFAALAFTARRGTFEVAVVWILVAGALAFLGDRGPGGGPLLMAAAQLTLLFALVEDSYRLAYHDGLTGLPGRRAFDEAMRLLDGDHTIAMVDIDHFKRFNDRHGHEAGDQALRMVADELSRVGGGGRAYRYGGEEFAVLFPGVSIADARNAIEQLRAAVAERGFSIRSPKRPRKKPERPIQPGKPVQRVTLTISAGLAERTLKNPDSGAVLRAADAALYRAKRAGRNRVLAQGLRARRRRTATRGSNAPQV
jgi:diguanylate cyclase (GGDEF)-like protein